MKRRKLKTTIAVLLLALFLLVISASPIYAVDTSSSNVTYVYTDNFTIGFAGPLAFTATIDTSDIESTMMAAANVTANSITNATNTLTAAQQDMLVDILELVLVLALAGFAYWHRDRLLFVLSGFAFIIYGFSYWQTSWVMSIILVLAGMYGFAKAKWGGAKG